MHLIPAGPNTDTRSKEQQVAWQLSTRNGTSITLCFRLSLRACFASASVCQVDEVVWNAHRVYGPARWPHLMANWEQVDRYSDPGSHAMYIFQKAGRYES
jgi:hypothetical protein